MDAAAFDQWLRHVFDRPVTDPAWYWNLDLWVPEPPLDVGLEYLTTLFSDPGRLLHEYSDAQVNQGLWFLISNACSSHIFALLKPECSWDDRRACIRAMHHIFRDLFDLRCSNHLSHIDERGASKLNSVCYMWWDILPVTAESPEQDAEFLAVMESSLALESIACQESALHGLGHWEMYHPDFVHKTIDAFLARNPDMHPVLYEYALSAREGGVM